MQRLLNNKPNLDPEITGNSKNISLPTQIREQAFEASGKYDEMGMTYGKWSKIGFDLDKAAGYPNGTISPIAIKNQVASLKVSKLC